MPYTTSLTHPMTMLSLVWLFYFVLMFFVIVRCLYFSQVFDYGACAGGHALHENLDFDILLFFVDDGG